MWTYFIVFLVVSHQYKTNKTMNFSLFFSKNEKYFPRTWEMWTYFIAFLVVSHQYKTNKTMNFSRFFEKWKNISPELRNLNIFYWFFGGFTSIQDQQNDEFFTFFKNEKVFPHEKCDEFYTCFEVRTKFEKKNWKTKIVSSKMDISGTRTRFLIVKRKGI